MRAVSLLLTVSLSLHLWPTIPTLPGAAPLADHSDAASRPRAPSLATLPAAALWAGARDAREQQDAAWLHLRGGGPKKAGGAKSAKQQQAKAKKFVEDKTFGLKNKNKSKKVQQFVKTVQAQAKDIAYDPKKAAEKKARKAAKEAEAALLAERELLYSGAAAAKKKEEAEPKTTKQLMEEYEYDVSVQKLSLPINVGGRFTVEQEIEEERAKLRNPDSVPGTPIEKEWFDQWSASLRAERARAGFGKRKKDEAARRPAVLTGRALFESVAQGDALADDDEADESWVVQGSSERSAASDEAPADEDASSSPVAHNPVAGEQEGREGVERSLRNLKI